MKKIGMLGGVGMAIVLSLSVAGCAEDGSELEGDEAALAAEEEEGAADVAPEEPGAVAEAAAASCEIHIGRTERSGNLITGRGSQANCGTSGTSYLTIQRSRWFGWENLVTKPVTGSGHEVFVYYGC